MTLSIRLWGLGLSPIIVDFKSYVEFRADLCTKYLMEIFVSCTKSFNDDFLRDVYETLWDIFHVVQEYENFR